MSEATKVPGFAAPGTWIAHAGVAHAGTTHAAAPAPAPARPGPAVDDDLTADLGDGVSLLFATPMLRLLMPDAARVNPGLRAAILRRAQDDDGKAISNVGGWQSRNDLLDWDIPEAAQLKTWIAAAVRQMAQHSPLLRARAPGTTRFRAYAWANVNRDGHYNRLHLHPGEHWSGVYYVDAGQPDPAIANNGVIEFLDPRPTARAMPIPGFKFDRGISVVPASGMLLLFPSWLDHWVSSYRGPGERISIAFNCTLE
ncbi:TIGR02466 family protein [Vineibacter terrae]|uniref:TIGR02466 family protein n=1 Tax=Vineibacter terrae TaxID=2586908 RepID=UPI002E33D478|nr:TIGR02466 family protein [Vineibacter terrae]HEX2886110.1 TIGR02466 family protein [Vineibacter terrae]